MNAQNPTSASLREKLTAWAGVVGGIALVLAGLLYLLTGQLSAAVFVCVLVGVGGLSAWVWGNPDEFQAWLAGRQTRYGTASVLVTVLFVGLIAYAYVLVDRANITADLTRVQRYTLNAPTREAISQLRERGFRVQLVGFFTRNKLREQEAADLITRQYEAEGRGVIEVLYIDPDEEPDLAARYNYQPGFDGTFALVVLDEQGQPFVREMEEGGQPRYMTLYLGEPTERNITTGLKTVASAGAFKVYFTVGHGERSLTQVDDNGISRLRASLEGQGIAAEELPLAEVKRVPEDADLVLIVGAWQPLSEAEVQALDEYLQRGGRLGIFADPPILEAAIVGEAANRFLAEGTPFSDYLWDEFGVRLRDAFVIETQPDLVNGSEWMPIINTIAPHTIMSDVRDEPISMRFARPITLVDAPDERQGRYMREPLLFTSEASFGEANIEEFLTNSRVEYNPAEGDIPGPLLVGVTVRRQLEFQEEVQPRLVIIGDSDVLKNEYVKSVPGNVFLWTDVVDWLTGFSEAVSFAPVSDPTLLKLVVSAQERKTIAVVTMIVLPGLVLLSGLAVWWYRRRL